MPPDHEVQSDSNLTVWANLWSRVLQPGYERLAGKITPKTQSFLERSQWWQPAALEDFQWQELAKLLAWAREKVPFYSDWFSRNRVRVADLVQARNLRALPIVDRTMMAEQPELFRASPQLAGSFSKNTGGTSGQPLRFMVNPKSDQWRTAVTRRGYGWAEGHNGMRQLHIWSADLFRLPLLACLKRALHRFLLRQRFVS